MLRTCLVVDDSRVIRKVARRIVEELGFEAAEAADGLEALAWCRAQMPTAILVDWNMPVMNGLEFVQAARKQPGLNSMRIMMVTTETQPEHVAKALAAGASEYLMKPFSSEAVAEKLAMMGIRVR